jgi:hypothetical protein
MEQKAIEDKAKPVQTFSIVIDGKNHSLVSFFAKNIWDIANDLEELLSAYEKAESTVSNKWKEWVLRHLSKSAKSIKWVINESHIKELVEAATHLEYSLFMVNTTLLLNRNDMR